MNRGKWREQHARREESEEAGEGNKYEVQRRKGIGRLEN